MLNWLNYHHLLYFREIARHGSMANASKALLIGQSTLSTQLKQLEDTLGQKLFDRKNKKLILTESGRVALEYSEEIFKKGEEFLQVFNEQSMTSRTIYRIGVVASAPKSVACNIMQMAKNFDPNSIISMQEDSPDVLIEKIQTHKLDIVLTNNISVIGQEDLQIKPVGSDKVSLYGSSEFVYLRENYPQSLYRVPMILPTLHSKLRYDLEQSFRDIGVKYQLVAEVQDSSVKKNLGMQGVGLIALPDFAATNFVSEQKLFKIGELPGTREEYWLVSKKRKITSPITDSINNNYSIFNN